MFEDIRKQVKNNKGLSNKVKKEFLEKIDKEEIDILIRTAPSDVKMLIYDYFFDDVVKIEILKNIKQNKRIFKKEFIKFFCIPESIFNEFKEYFYKFDEITPKEISLLSDSLKNINCLIFLTKTYFLINS